MAMKKMRQVDFSVDEMCELTGLERKQFTDGLKKFCELYGFELEDFKADESLKKSTYYFPPEVAEPLALVIKYLPYNPRYRKNANKENITATEYAKYNHMMLEDIDNKLPKFFKEAIYSLMGHLVNYEVSVWAAPFVKELTYFMLNLTTIQKESAGAALRTFTKKLDGMNYHLYEGSYFWKKAADGNEEYLKEKVGLDEPSEIDRVLQEQNISLDRLIAALIRWELKGAHEMRELGFPELKDVLDMKNEQYRILGEKCEILNDDGKVLFKDIPNPSPEEQRKAYYDLVMAGSINRAQFLTNEHAYKTMRGNWEKWVPIFAMSELMEDTNDDRYKEMYGTYLEQEIDRASEYLSDVKKEKEEYEKTGKVPESFFNKVDLDRDILSSYAEYCRGLDEMMKKDKKEKEEKKEKADSLLEITNHFVGAALYEFLNRS